MRSLGESRKRWNETQRNGDDVSAWQRAVKFNGPNSPCEAGCRSVCWKAFLLFRDVSPAKWSFFLREARVGYEALRERYLQFIKHPERLAELTLDPLADDPESPWDAFRRDETVRAEILQDVRRLPDDPLYHQEDIQTLILDVLFVFCKHNPELGGYRQGMHELLAPLVYVLHQDAIDSATLPTPLEPADSVITEILDARFIEHDAYALFSKIMDNAKGFYEINSSSSSGGTDALNPPMTNELFSVSAQTDSAGGVDESAIVEMSKAIHDGLLMNIDRELAVHLKDIEILPQIFLIRWIRLLFGREFPFQQHLTLWDSIFAFDPDLNLVPLICVAMLLRIRWELLDADYSVALQSLLKYPPPQPPHGPHTFVDDAVFLQDHLDAAGGANLILKYTGRSPARVSTPPQALSASTSRPSTPSSALAAGLGNLRSRTLRAARSPLRSSKYDASQGGGAAAGAPHSSASPPSRFIQNRESMEAMFQNAAKGVLERGEKLGINQAVRDAVGEIRRNMVQSFQEARQVAKSSSRAGSGSGADLLAPSPGGKRVSYGQAMRTIADMERRNQQLASMLDETVTTLKSLAENSSKAHKKANDEETVFGEQRQHQWLEAVELAAAKVQFVKVHLEDASLTLPLDEPAPESLAQDTPMTASDVETQIQRNTPGEIYAKSEEEGTSEATQVDSSVEQPSNDRLLPPMETSKMASPSETDRMDMDEERQSVATPATPLSTQPELQTPIPESEQQKQQQPQQQQPRPQPHPIPSRSTLAQSSFAWMLEPGDTASSTGSSSRGGTMSNNAPSSTPTKRPSRTGPAGRGRHAFLFGEVVGQSPLGNAHSNDGASNDPLADTHRGPDGASRSVIADEIFGLEPLRQALPKSKE